MEGYLTFNNMQILKTLEIQNFIYPINLSIVFLGKISENSCLGMIGWETYGGTYVIL